MSFNVTRLTPEMEERLPRTVDLIRQSGPNVTFLSLVWDKPHNREAIAKGIDGNDGDFYECIVEEEQAEADKIADEDFNARLL